MSFQITEQTLQCQTFPSNRSSEYSFPPVNVWAWHSVAEIGKTKKSWNEPIVADILVLKSSVITALNSWSFFCLLASSLQISLVVFFKMVLFSSVKFKAQSKQSKLSFFYSHFFRNNWCILKWKCLVLKMLKFNLFSKVLFSRFFCSPNNWEDATYGAG